MPDTNFVTIAQAAAQLGISERHVRRYLPQLSPEDLRTDGSRVHRGQPVTLIRLGALWALRNEQSNGHTADTADGVSGKATDTAPVVGGENSRQTVSVEILLAEKDARIADFQERIQELTSSLENEREAHKRAELLHLNTQGELSALRDRAAQLEQLNTRLIEALPTDGKPTGATGNVADILTGEKTETPSVDPYQNTVSVPTESPLEGTTEPIWVETPSDNTEGKNEQPVSQSRRWWQLWKR